LKLDVMSPIAMVSSPLRDEMFAANRAAGHIALAVAAGSRGTRRSQVHEAGSLRVRFPHGNSRILDAVIINTAGGMAGGDRFDIDIKVRAGAKLSVTTAAAEKIYRSLGPDTEIDVKLDVGPGGTLAWLPQETILFDRARLRRNIDVELAADASLLFAEAGIFGRSAMGEAMVSGRYFDRWRVHVGGSLAFVEAVRLDSGIAQRLAERAIAAGGAAVATVLKIPGRDDDVAAVRALQQYFSGEVGASSWNGLTLVRCVSSHGAPLRHDLTKVLTALGSEPLPRLWLN
jgi:urease accessory protein